MSSRADQSRISSTTISAASQGGQVPPSVKKDTPALGESANGGQPVVTSSVKQSLDEGIVAKTADASEVTLESLPEKKQKSEGEGLHAEEEVQQKLCTVEPGQLFTRLFVDVHHRMFQIVEVYWFPPVSRTLLLFLGIACLVFLAHG